MLALWSMLTPRFRPPSGAPRGVRLPSRPLHVMQLTQKAEIPQLVRTTRINMIHMITRATTEHATTTIPANDSLTDPRPVRRQRPAAP